MRGAAMWKYIILGIALLTLVGTGCSTQSQEQNSSGYIDLPPAEAKELIDNNPDLIIIDVLIFCKESLN